MAKSLHMESGAIQAMVGCRAMSNHRIFQPSIGFRSTWGNLRYLQLRSAS